MTKQEILKLLFNDIQAWDKGRGCNDAVKNFLAHLNLTATDTPHNGWQLVFQGYTGPDGISPIIAILNSALSASDLNLDHLSGLIQNHPEGSALYWTMGHYYRYFFAGESFILTLTQRQPQFVATQEFAQAICARVATTPALFSRNREYPDQSVLECLEHSKRPTLLARLCALNVFLYRELCQDNPASLQGKRI